MDGAARVPFVYMFVIVLLFVIVAMYPPGMLLLIGLIYAVSGPIQALLRNSRRK